MRQEDWGKESLHHLRQLQMRVRFAHERSTPDEHVTALPKRAPALWLDRENVNENPVTFIRREYASALSHGLSRNVLRTLDMSLYEALRHYLKKYGTPADFDLPTKTEMIDRKVAAAGRVTIIHSSEQREKLRLSKAAQRRAKKRREEPK